MLRAVRAGKSMHAVAREFEVSVSTVAFWVGRAGESRLDRVDFSDRAPGCARGWNRTSAQIEHRIVELRSSLRERSVLGEYGAKAIHAALKAEHKAPPSVASINRVLARHGLQDISRRIRRPAPPKGWYLPAVAAAEAEVDCFDFIEDLKIAEGPLACALTAKSLLGALTDAWILRQRTAAGSLACLQQRWQRDGLPAYAQFDNDTVFQGAHQYADTVGRVSRLCLALGVTPVFVPPLEHGMQNSIESFNALWQTKVWQRHRVTSIAELQACSDRYIAAHRARTAGVVSPAPARRPWPKGFQLNLQAPLTGQMIFIRRTTETGHAHLLARRFAISPDWPHRLVRCEVDFAHHRIRCFALRRRAPTEQPLLATIEYRRSDKPFQGEP